MRIPRSALLVGMWLTFGAAQAASIHVIPRADAEALVPVIQPLLGDDGYVNAYQGKLIIRTSDTRFSRIRKLLDSLSATPRTVTIFLRRRAYTAEGGAGVYVEPDGVTVNGGKRRHRSQQVYSVSTLSGEPVRISRGSLVAVTGSEYPALVSLQQGIVAKPMVTADGRVRLTIRQSFDRPEGRGRFSTQGAATTLMLTPGQWQPLGSIRVNSSDSGAGLGGVSSRSQRTSLPLEVKVELQ